LVLVDGIEVSDPFAGEFDIGTLQAEIGSRVEVLRGPQSALYGSDAIGGVVAYESSTHDGFEARVEAGSNDTINASAHLGLRNDTALLALNATLVSTDGQPNARDGVRDIGRDSYTLSGRALVDPAPNVQLRAAGRFIHTQGDFNDQDFDSTSPTFGLVIDSPGTRFENDAIYALAGARVDFLDGRWLHDVSAQLADIDRNSFASFGRTNGNEGNRLKLSYVSALSFSNAHHLTFAADWERERFRNDDPFGVGFSERRQIENVGLVGEYRFAGDRFDFDAALRHDINDRFADETTFRFGAGYRLSDNTRIRASAGTGIKNPGFFELFGFFDGRFIGNEDLTPEQSTSWEIGLDHTLPNGKARFSLTYFDSELEDEIFTSFPAPDFVATPANRNSDSQQSGVEVSARAFLGGGFTIDAAYSFLNAKEDGVEEVRRPDNIASLVVNWATRDDRLSANLAMRYNGDAEDLAFIDPSFIPLRVTLDDYTLVNFNIAYQVNPSAQLFARAENLLNEEYEQVFSFTNPGRSVLAGVRISI
jgi:vitamin B12 transporter